MELLPYSLINNKWRFFTLKGASLILCEFLGLALILVETLGLTGCGMIGNIIGSSSPSRPAQPNTVEGTHNKLDSGSKQAVAQNRAAVSGHGASLGSGDFQRKIEGLKRFDGKTGSILGFCPLPLQEGQNKGAILSVADTGEVLVWKADFSQKFLALKVPHPISAFACGSRTGVIATSYEQRIEIFRLDSEKPPVVLNRIETRAAALSLDPNEESLLIGGIDGRVYRWRFIEAQKNLSLKEKSRVLERYFGHSSPVSAVAYHPFGRMFFSADITGGLSGWLASNKDLFEGKFDENLFAGRFLTEKAVKGNAGRGDAVGINQLLLSTDGQTLVSLLQDGRVEWWLVRGFKKVAEIQAHKGLMYAGALSGDGKTLVTVGRDGTIKEFSLVTEGPDDSKFSIAQLKELPATSISSISILPDNRIISGLNDGSIKAIQFPA